MSFANEMKEFLASYTAVTEMGEKKKDREQRGKKNDADIAYQEAMIELQREQHRARPSCFRPREVRLGEGQGCRSGKTCAFR
jgi:hypothetical protein